MRERRGPGTSQERSFGGTAVDAEAKALTSGPERMT